MAARACSCCHGTSRPSPSQLLAHQGSPAPPLPLGARSSSRGPLLPRAALVEHLRPHAVVHLSPCFPSSVWPPGEPPRTRELVRQGSAPSLGSLLARHGHRARCTPGFVDGSSRALPCCPTMSPGFTSLPIIPQSQKPHQSLPPPPESNTVSPPRVPVEKPSPGRFRRTPPWGSV